MFVVFRPLFIKGSLGDEVRYMVGEAGNVLQRGWKHIDMKAKRGLYNGVAVSNVLWLCYIMTPPTLAFSKW